jgi:hypothetical protein
MRLVRLGTEPTKVGADVRAALAAWGTGTEVLGGVAVFGWTPPDNARPLDAVLVLPRGVIVVVGVDLPEPALTLDAPLHTPWTVDGWPLVRTEGAANPGLDALESASGLASSLQSHGAEPLPVATILAIGPFVGQVTQPTNDLHRGVRVLHPSPASMLAAARELATYQHTCAAESAQQLLMVLDEQAGELNIAELAAEGFPDVLTPDLASADTMLIGKVGDGPDETAQPVHVSSGRGISRRIKLIALGGVLLVVCAVIVALVVVSRPAATSAPPAQEPTTRVDGVQFVQKDAVRDASCAQHSFGDVQASFAQQPCTGLTRVTFDTQVSGRRAAVAVSIVDMPDEPGAAKLREVLNTVGTGGIVDLVAEGRRWDGGPRSFGGSAQVIEQIGTRVRIVQTVWALGGSQPEDIGLRALAERATRLPIGP